MTFEPLGSDFYGYENLLTDQEKEALTALRGYLESEVRPIVNGYWDRAEFPSEIVKPLAELGAYSLRAGRRPARSRTPRCSAASWRWSWPASTHPSPPSSACRTA